MIIVSSFSIQDVARAINEKRYLTPDEIRRASVVVLDDAPAPSKEGGQENDH